MNYYTHYKNLHDTIKPIRGRAEDVRPIGRRHRDWETIEMDGDVVACRLFNTHVVRYYPNGSIGVRCDSWATNLTAEFVHTHSPWQCYKRNNKLWVIVGDADGGYKHYPVPDRGELVFERGDKSWQPVGDVVIEKRVINRSRAKEARAPYQPFLEWAKTFLKMSDGWIMHETRKQVMRFSLKNGFSRGYDESEMMGLARSTEQDDWLKAMCQILWTSPDEWREAETYNYTMQWNGSTHNLTQRYTDERYRFVTLKNRLYRMIEKATDIHDTVQVSVTDKALRDIV